MARRWYEETDGRAHVDAMRTFVKEILKREEFEGFKAQEIGKTGLKAGATLTPGRTRLSWIPLLGRFFTRRVGERHSRGLGYAMNTVRTFNAMHGIRPAYGTNFKKNRIDIEFTVERPR